MDWARVMRGTISSASALTFPLASAAEEIGARGGLEERDEHRAGAEHAPPPRRRGAGRARTTSASLQRGGGVGGDRRAGLGVGVVGEAGAEPRAALHHHLGAALHELRRALRNERDAPFIRTPSPSGPRSGSCARRPSILLHHALRSA